MKRELTAGVIGLTAATIGGLSLYFSGWKLDPSVIPWGDIAANAIGALIGGWIAVALALHTADRQRKLSAEDEALRREREWVAELRSELALVTDMREAMTALAEATEQTFKAKIDNLVFSIDLAADMLRGYVSRPRLREVIQRVIDASRLVEIDATVQRNAFAGTIGAHQEIPGLREIARRGASVAVSAESDYWKWKNSNRF